MKKWWGCNSRLIRQLPYSIWLSIWKWVARLWLNEVSVCCPDRPLQFFQLASQCAVCAVQQCRERTLNMNLAALATDYCTLLHWITPAHKGWESEREMWARQIVQPTDIHSLDEKNGDLLLFSLSLSPPPPPPTFNQTYYSQLIPKCEWTVWYSAQEQLNFSCVLFACCVCWRTTVERNFSFSSSSSSPHPTCSLSFFLL